jgi:hypothetical protein
LPLPPLAAVSRAKKNPNDDPRLLRQIPVQLLNFRYVPVRHQLNVVLVTSVVWTALLSAWYPPTNNADGAKSQPEEEGEEKKNDKVVSAAPN